MMTLPLTQGIPFEKILFLALNMDMFLGLKVSVVDVLCSETNFKQTW